MKRKVLVVNSGSSTLKFKLFALPEEEVIVKGMVDRLGLDHSVFEITYQGQKHTQEIPINSHVQAVEILIKQLLDLNVINDVQDISGIGHRVVSGGPYFDDSTLLNEQSLSKLSQIDEYAPLHNPAERKGIEAFAQMLPEVPQVAVFDTTFHKKLPKMNQVYSIPKEYDEKFGAHRYGAHGTSHDYVSHKAAEFLDIPYSQQKMISLHMGSGVSVTAIKDGHSFDTSMGFTPISGVTMSSRAGDIDISLVAFLMEKLQINDIHEMIDILNNESGLKGISGISPDMRDLISAKDSNPDAKLAIEVFINRIVKYIGSYIAEMHGIDVMIFTAGMGENNPVIRQAIMDNFNFLGMKVDQAANENGKGIRQISAPDSKITALVVPTDEELMIVHEFERLVK
ncbi:MAG: acetate kinase [Lactobacillus sp.]|uniref:Acetate kinase n=1 Tax=Bombilactobacillus bombi TaxID=1303590 RepID=A0A347SRS6_9LACO|nr:acetate kinase [Bombilactobacillus bombi]AXX64735.1 acetate kinase [Bombilactobacillus bombi]MCO6541981.1 acetate kinase [Lactobacillus sp.]MCO6542693.1 acetate kinase [Lactobacillus sp.]RHW50061.1 acetate kinase [Bombilactobacillus bombi]